MSRATQNRRVEVALERAGAHGITSADFNGDGPTIDGGPVIQRVNRCIDDLQAAGVDIPDPPLAHEFRRDGCVIYRLGKYVRTDPVAVLREEPEDSMYAPVEKGSGRTVVVEIVNADAAWLNEALDIVEAAEAARRRDAA